MVVPQGKPEDSAHHNRQHAVGSVVNRRLIDFSYCKLRESLLQTYKQVEQGPVCFVPRI